MVAFKPLHENRPETEAEEFNRLYPEGSEVRRVKELELNAAGIPIPGVSDSLNSSPDPEQWAEFLKWKKSQEPDTSDVAASDIPSEVPAWR